MIEKQIEKDMFGRYLPNETSVLSPSDIAVITGTTSAFADAILTGTDEENIELLNLAKSGVNTVMARVIDLLPEGITKPNGTQFKPILCGVIDARLNAIQAG